MYNHNQKELFIEQLSSPETRPSFKSMFERIATYEEDYDSDVATLDPGTIISIINQIAGRTRSKETELSRIKNYCKFRLNGMLFPLQTA